ncbi:MAG: FmdB family zinc ribbon protein [Actinomycetota bacterium]
MPTYEYACTSCHRHIDAVQRFTDPPLETCEECGGALKRVFHPVGIVLKGSGFYSTDNRSRKRPFTPKDGSKEPAKDSKDTAASSASASGESKESKSEKPQKPEKSEKKTDSARTGSSTGSSTGSAKS